MKWKRRSLSEKTREIDLLVGYGRRQRGTRNSWKRFPRTQDQRATWNFRSMPHPLRLDRHNREAESEGKSGESKREKTVDRSIEELPQNFRHKQKTEKCIAFFRFRFRISVMLTSSSFSSPLPSSRVSLLLFSLPPSWTSPPSNFP